MSVWVGNDIVDLTDPDSVSRSIDDPFVDRICSPGEKRFLAQSVDPDTQVWYLWSAKETAFKIMRRKDPSQVFYPSRFIVDRKRKHIHYQS